MTATPPTPDAGGPGPAGAAGSDTPPPPPPPEGPRVSGEQMRDLGRLRRSATDRKVAGVAGGIARHFDVDPLVVRILFVVLVFFGGGGLLLYGACWLLVPDEATGRATIHVDERSRTVALAIVGGIAALSVVGDTLGGWGFPWPLAIAGIVAAVLIAHRGPRQHPGPLPTATAPPGSGGAYGSRPADSGPAYTGYHPGPAPRPVHPRKRGPILFGFTAALAAVAVGVVLTFDLAGMDVPPSTYPATVLAACGLMLVIGAFYGRPGGLIAVGLLAAIATLATSAVDQVDAGQIDVRPQTAAELADHYALTAGEIKIDLTDIDDPDDLDDLDGRVLDLDVRFGRIEVVVPDQGLDVQVDARIEGGDVRLFGQRSSESATASHDGGGVGTPELEIDTDMFLGEVVVTTEEAA